MANNRNRKKNNGQKQLFLLPVEIPSFDAVNNGKEVFQKLLKIIDAEMICDEMPSAIIKEALKELDAYQLHLFYSKITDSRNMIETIKDVADNKICKSIDERTEKLLTVVGAKNPPVELIGRVFATVDYINSSNQNIWLSELRNQLEKNYKMLVALAMKIAFFAPAQAINYLKSLEYFLKQKKLNEVLK